MTQREQLILPGAYEPGVIGHLVGCLRTIGSPESLLAAAALLKLREERDDNANNLHARDARITALESMLQEAR